MTTSRIPLLREERGWTRARLAEESGVGARTVRRMEAGRAAGQETLRLVAVALGVEVHDLFLAAGPGTCPADAVTARRRQRPLVVAVVVLALGGAAGGTVGAGLLPGQADAAVRARISLVEPATLLPPRGDQERLAAAIAAVATTPLVLQEADRHLASPVDQRMLAESVASRVLPGDRIVVTARAGSGMAAAERAEAVLDALITELPPLMPSGEAGQVRITRVGRPTQHDPQVLDLLVGAGIGTGGGMLAGALLIATGSWRGRRRPEAPRRIAVA